jgi:hyperosmotically inducible protein
LTLQQGSLGDHRIQGRDSAIVICPKHEQGETRMKFGFRSLLSPFLLSGLVLGIAALGVAQDSTQPTNSQADNTKVNERDRNANEPTADQQKDNSSDREITQQIRKAIVNDKSLSTYAHNIKVITKGGMVTLKGPVQSEDEKKAIEAKAADIAGESKVTSQLDVKPKQ